MANLGDVLYRKKGKSESDSEATNDSEDVWDDNVLINFYDKALKVAQEQVAKRLAMSTNTAPDALEKDVVKSPFKNPNDSNVTSSKNKVKKKSKKKHVTLPHNDVDNFNENGHTWHVGAKCRATFSENGVDYEATIEHILDDENCIVTYVGYENQDVVPLSSLEPSLGKYQRILQTQQANLEATHQIEGSDHEMKGNLDSEIPLEHCRDYIPPSTVSGSKSNRSKPKIQKPIKYAPSTKNSAVPSFQFPPFEPSLNHHSMLPPPPMPFLMNGNNSSHDGDEALSKMLMSWYMSGYYTGLYEGQKNAQRHSKKRSSHRM